MKPLLRFRTDRRGMMPLVIAGVVVLLLVAGIVAFLFVTNPHVLVNSPPQGKEFIIYASAGGTWAINEIALAGAFVGGFTQTHVDTSSSPPPFGLGTLFGGCISCKGQAWVQADVTGPGDLSIQDVKSEKTSLTFGPFDVLSHTGDFRTGTVGYWEHGTTTWDLELHWEVDSTDYVLATASVTKEV